jgi:hypothetical protein
MTERKHGMIERKHGYDGTVFCQCRATIQTFRHSRVGGNPNFIYIHAWNGCMRRFAAYVEIIEKYHNEVKKWN